MRRRIRSAHSLSSRADVGDLPTSITGGSGLRCGGAGHRRFATNVVRSPDPVRDLGSRTGSGSCARHVRGSRDARRCGTVASISVGRCVGHRSTCGAMMGVGSGVLRTPDSQAPHRAMWRGCRHRHQRDIRRIRPPKGPRQSQPFTQPRPSRKCPGIALGVRRSQCPKPRQMSSRGRCAAPRLDGAAPSAILFDVMAGCPPARVHDT